eukprot:gene16919-biopygen7195
MSEWMTVRMDDCQRGAPDSRGGSSPIPKECSKYARPHREGATLGHLDPTAAAATAPPARVQFVPVRRCDTIVEAGMGSYTVRPPEEAWGLSGDPYNLGLGAPQCWRGSARGSCTEGEKHPGAMNGWRTYRRSASRSRLAAGLLAARRVY